jgi:hypothetical protein
VAAAIPLVFVGIAIAVGAILITIFFSGFSIGTIGTTTSNPFGPGEGPPKIIMTYQENEYEGQLLGYVWGERRSFTELPEINIENVTSVSEQNIINIEKGSRVSFNIAGNRPPESPYDALSVTAYTETGTPISVLDANGSPRNNTYSTSALEADQYVLVSIATWYPDEREEIITGYVAYGHRINITGSEPDS